MNITDKINFRQPKYVLPAIVYLPLLFTGYFVCDFFNLKPVETSKMETTNYYNDKLPSANIKGDGIGQKYQNMVENFGKIKDGSAVENIEGRTEKEKEKYGWEFLFIGANIDAVETAKHFGISENRAVDYCADGQGTAVVYDAVADTVCEMRAAMPICNDWSKKVKKDFKWRTK